MLACIDLTRRGFHVFRGMSPQCACDLIAMRDGQCWRIEVRTGWENPATANASWPVRASDQADVYAVVIGDQIGYLPESFAGEPFPWISSTIPRALAALERP